MNPRRNFRSTFMYDGSRTASEQALVRDATPPQAAGGGTPPTWGADDEGPTVLQSPGLILRLGRHVDDMFQVIAFSLSNTLPIHPASYAQVPAGQGRRRRPPPPRAPPADRWGKQRGGQQPYGTENATMGAAAPPNFPGPIAVDGTPHALHQYDDGISTMADSAGSLSSHDSTPDDEGIQFVYTIVEATSLEESHSSHPPLEGRACWDPSQHHDSAPPPAVIETVAEPGRPNGVGASPTFGGPAGVVNDPPRRGTQGWGTLAAPSRPARDVRSPRTDQRDDSGDDRPPTTTTW
jgi:hypothetical protein